MFNVTFCRIIFRTTFRIITNTIDTPQIDER